MKEAYYEILDWSEVWALLIPLFYLWKYPAQPKYLRPVIIYLWLALLIDIPIDLAYKFKPYVPSWMWPNNYLYNIHSIVRFACFAAFFIALKQPFLGKLKRILPFITLAFVLINFILYEHFFTPSTFSSRLLATEAGVLLFYCLQYYLFKLQEDNPQEKRKADFWVVTGLAIYVVFNFPFFLLYTSLEIDAQINWWYFHNISYIVLCIFIAKAFYVSRNRP